MRLIPFLTGVVLALSQAAGPAAAQTPVDLELVLASDGSGSIDDAELRLQREGYAAAITHPTILSAIAAGYHQAIALAFVEWGGPFSQHTVVDWMVIRDAETAAAFAERLRSAPRMATSYNSISEAIFYSADLIATNAYEGRRKIIDVSGDGPQMNGRPLAEAHALTRSMGITINGLVVMAPSGALPGPRGEALEDHYRNDVIDGRGAFVVVAEGRQDFARAVLRKMILEIAERAATSDREDG